MHTESKIKFLNSNMKQQIFTFYPEKSTDYKFHYRNPYIDRKNVYNFIINHINYNQVNKLINSEIV